MNKINCYALGRRSVSLKDLQGVTLPDMVQDPEGGFVLHADHVAALEALADELGTLRYVVQPGDTLARIAQRLGGGLEVADLVRLNLITNPDRIYPGQVLNLGMGRHQGAQPSAPAADQPNATITDNGGVQLDLSNPAVVDRLLALADQFKAARPAAGLEERDAAVDTARGISK